MGDEVATSLTNASLVYERLRSDILSGSLPPSAKLRIDRLRERYGVGPIPLREALNRLLSEGFVSLEDRKGFFVPAVSVAELDELTQTRLWLNEIVVRESLANGDTRWEERVVITTYYLMRTPREPSDSDSVINREWERHHHDFHMAIVAACPSRWLRDLHLNLFDAADRYRHQYLAASTSVGTRDVQAEHQEMSDLALARDAPGLTAAYNRHIERTTDIIKASVHATKGASEGRSRRSAKEAK